MTIGRRVTSLGEIRADRRHTSGPGQRLDRRPGKPASYLKPNARDENAPPVRPQRPARRIPAAHLPGVPWTARWEIRASIGSVVGGEDDGWHGYLDEGHTWRQA